MESVTLDDGVTRYLLPESTFTNPQGEQFSCWWIGDEYAGEAGEYIEIEEDTTLTAQYGVPSSIILQPGTASGEDIVLTGISGQYVSMPYPEELPDWYSSGDLLFFAYGVGSTTVDIYESGSLAMFETTDEYYMAVWTTDVYVMNYDSKNGNADNQPFVDYVNHIGLPGTVSYILPDPTDHGWTGTTENPDFMGYYTGTGTDPAGWTKLGDPGDDVGANKNMRIHGLYGHN